jgi:hypothetical protein
MRSFRRPSAPGKPPGARTAAVTGSESRDGRSFKRLSVSKAPISVPSRRRTTLPELAPLTKRFRRKKRQGKQ